MSMLAGFKTRISMACSSVNSLESKILSIDKAFEFPTTATECNAFIADKMAEIEEIQISLTGLLENLEVHVQNAINFIGARKDQSEGEKLMNELDTFLTPEANRVQLEAIHWTNKLKYRMREFEKQSSLIDNLASSTAQTPPQDTDTASTLSARQYSENKVRLPTLEVPTFNGNYKDYPTFWTIYNSLIHSNPQLSDIDKFLFLRQALKGSAASMLGNMPVVGENYEKAITLLDKRFNKSGCIADLLITELEKLSRAREDATSCRRTLTEVSEKLTHIECAGVSLGNDRMWRRLILSKFPESMSKEVLSKEQKDGKSLSTDEILQILENAVALNETVELTTATFNGCTIAGRSSPYHDEERESYYAEDMTSRTKERSPHENLRICLCGSSSHKALHCLTFKTPAERRNEARKRRLCFRCLRGNHRMSDCNRSCSRCNGDHHTALCVDDHSNIHHASPPRRLEHRQLLENSSSSEIVQNSQILRNEKRTERVEKQHVLMTATALAFNRNTKDYQPVNIFFDGGAQKSFISTSKADALDLPTTRSTTFKISGFGGTTETFLSNEVSLTMKSIAGESTSKKIKMHSKSSLTSPMSTAWLSSADRRSIRKRKVRIAQPNLKTRVFTPDILIGQDLIDQFVMHDKPCIILPSGLILTPTIFGHAISGNGRMKGSASTTYSQNTAVISRSAETQKQSATTEDIVLSDLAKHAITKHHNDEIATSKTPRSTMYVRLHTNNAAVGARNVSACKGKATYTKATYKFEPSRKWRNKRVKDKSYLFKDEDCKKKQMKHAPPPRLAPKACTDGMLHRGKHPPFTLPCDKFNSSHFVICS